MQDSRGGDARPVSSLAGSVPPGAGHLPPLFGAWWIRNHSLAWSPGPGPWDLELEPLTSCSLAALCDGAPQDWPQEGRPGRVSPPAQSSDFCRATRKLSHRSLASLEPSLVSPGSKSNKRNHISFPSVSLSFITEIRAWTSSLEKERHRKHAWQEWPFPGVTRSPVVSSVQDAPPHPPHPHVVLRGHMWVRTPTLRRPPFPLVSGMSVRPQTPGTQSREVGFPVEKCVLSKKKWLL